MFMNFTISVQRRTSSARELMAVPSLLCLHDSYQFHISFRAAVVPVCKCSLKVSLSPKELEKENKMAFVKLNTSRDVTASRVWKTNSPTHGD